MSGHRNRPWYKRYPSDFLAGTRGMRPILHKTYTRLLDGMYEYGGPLPDDVQRLTHLVEVRPRDLPRLIGELVAAGKIEVVDGLIHNKRTDVEIERMSLNWSATEKQQSDNRSASNAQDEPKLKAYRGKKRNKNYARASDPPRDPAHPRPEAEADSNKALPLQAESLITAADASLALPPREAAAVASPGLEGRSLPAPVAQDEPEFSDEHRAKMLKRISDLANSLPSEPAFRPPLERDANGVPRSRLMERLKAKEPSDDDADADTGGDRAGQGELPQPSGAAPDHAPSGGLFGALEAAIRASDEEGEE